MVDYKKTFYEIFDKSTFGVEIEGCGIFYPTVEECEAYGVGGLERNECFMNKIIKSDTFPKLVGADKLPIQQLSIFASGYHGGYDRIHKWIYEGDCSIACKPTVNVKDFSKHKFHKYTKPTAAEIVSPILHMAKKEFHSGNITSNDVWDKLKKEVEDTGTPQERNPFSEGLFVMTLYTSLLFNNDTGGKAGRLYPAALNRDGKLSTGLHMHYSNPEMMNDPMGRCALLYLLNNMVALEKIFLLFLDPARSLNHYSKIAAEMHFGAIDDSIKGLNDTVFNNTYEKCFDGGKFTKLCAYNDPYYPGFGDRYWSINLTHAAEQITYNKHEPIHIEFRIHHGSIYTKEIHHWVCFLNCFIASCITKIKIAFAKSQNVKLSDSDKKKELEKHNDKINSIAKKWASKADGHLPKFNDAVKIYSNKIQGISTEIDKFTKKYLGPNSVYDEISKMVDLPSEKTFAEQKVEIVNHKLKIIKKINSDITENFNNVAYENNVKSFMDSINDISRERLSLEKELEKLNAPYDLESIKNEIKKISINYYGNQYLDGVIYSSAITQQEKADASTELLKLLFSEFVPDKELCAYYIKKINFYSGEVFNNVALNPVDFFPPDGKNVQVTCPKYFNSLTEKKTLAALNKMENSSLLIEQSKLIGLKEFDEWAQKVGISQAGGSIRESTLSSDKFALKYSKYMKKINKIEKLLK